MGTVAALDAGDPAMNVALLMLLAGYDVDAVVTEVGYEIYKHDGTLYEFICHYKRAFVFRCSGEAFKGSGTIYRPTNGIKEAIQNYGTHRYWKTVLA